MRQHKELLHRLDDAEKLQLYAKEAVSKHRALEESLDKAKSRSRYWEHKAKEDTNRTAGVENKGNEAMEEAQIARMAIVAVGEAKAWVEEDPARVQGALTAAEGAKATTDKTRRKAEAKAARLEVEWTSLLLKLGTTKDEVSSFQSQAGKDKEAMRMSLEVIFAYGYGCSVFKHDICGDQPEVSDGMPDFVDQLSPEFFASPKCPPVPASSKATTTEVRLDEAPNDLEGTATVGDQS